jgi:hypothetical protein
MLPDDVAHLALDRKVQPAQVVDVAALAAHRRYERGYGWMFPRHIRQADEGCDFDFLETQFGEPVGEPDIF